jgi:hypothetical protein
MNSGSTKRAPTTATNTAVAVVSTDASSPRTGAAQVLHGGGAPMLLPGHVSRG